MVSCLCAGLVLAKTGLDTGLGLGPNGGSTVSGPVTPTGIDYDGAWSVYTNTWNANYTTAWE